jgi:hypothetical protein
MTIFLDLEDSNVFSSEAAAWSRSLLLKKLLPLNVVVYEALSGVLSGLTSCGNGSAAGAETKGKKRQNKAMARIITVPQDLLSLKLMVIFINTPGFLYRKGHSA